MSERSPVAPGGLPHNVVRANVGSRPAPYINVGNGELVALDVGAAIGGKRSMVDLCFVFDSTGSMSNKVQGLVTSLADMVSQLDKLELDWRTTCVPFGDLTVPGDRIDGDLPFVSSVEAAQSQLRAMPKFDGGANDGESAVEAMLAALGKLWRPSAVKLVVLLTDEPALGGVQIIQSVDHRLRRAEAICFVASPNIPYYRRWAEDFGGRWLQIGPNMDTGSIVALLRTLVGEIVRVAAAVHVIAAGSVRRYLELEVGKGSAPSGHGPDEPA